MSETETDDVVEPVKAGLFDGWPDINAESESSGFVARVNTSLGMVDWQEYGPGTREGINALTGRTDGVVSGADWALFMPELKKGNLSGDLRALRVWLGLKASNWFDDELATALGTETLDRSVWAKLAGLKEREVDD